MSPLSSRSQRAAVASAVALMLLGTSCGFGLAKRGSKPVTSATIKVSYGQGLELEEPRAQTRKVGTLRLKVLDERGKPLRGIYVRYRGPKKGRIATDAKGTVRRNLPAGRYLIDLPPCGITALPESPGEVDVVIVAGQTAVGIIPNIPWKRRYYPTPSVRLHEDAPWDRNEPVRMGVRIEDGCRFTEAPGASVAVYRWRLSRNFALVDAPARAGKDGFATVVVRCTRRGDGGIIVYDPNDPSVNVDLLAAVSDQPGPWCR